jgi:RimJ/RimL family protein N-acetyltransferase
MGRMNGLGQPIGEALPGWTARPRPRRVAMAGRTCRLEPLDPGRHEGALFEAFAADAEGRNWTYLLADPPTTRADFTAFLATSAASEDPLAFAIIAQAGDAALGLASYMRIDPANGVIEVGGIHYAEAMKRSAMATEAMVLMMRRAFDELGYRRYEWKCDALNAPSRRAALRLGFTYEGLFRQAVVTKGRSRDTAWYSIIDKDWPALKRAYERWLEPGNFDGEGRQRRGLGEVIAQERGGGERSGP